MDTLTVTIASYDKFKGRKDVAHPNWFKLSNRLLEDPDFYCFKPEEILVWIQILAVSSQKQSATVTLNLEHLERVCRLAPDSVMSAIDKLRDKKILSCAPAKKKARTQTLRERHARREEKREEETRREEKRVPAVAVAVTAPSPGGALVAHYCEAYKSRYNTNPVIRPQDAKLLKNLAEAQGVEKAKALVTAYLRMSSQFFVSRSHSVAVLHSDLNTVQNYLAHGKTITRQDAFNAEANDALKNQIERLGKGGT